ncbi:hypothetical protein [Paludisphaera sp.]|uniref:hypothetical protein n=1 Tax=Paludisphaera sp. TaxID=2017432 RepID=UPI00301CD627
MAGGAESMQTIRGGRGLFVVLGVAVVAGGLLLRGGVAPRLAAASPMEDGPDAGRPGAEPPPLDPVPAPLDAGRANAATKAVPRFQGTAAPGLRITLSATESRGEDLQYRWTQTAGPAVRLDDPAASEVSVMVPGNAKELAFELVAAGRGGIDRAPLDIPLLLHAEPAPPVAVADAGDDQVAVVGRRVTLNGIRSKPRDRAAFRWIQVEGPPVTELVEESWICSFVPTAPGVYRFVLVIACDREISKPDEVLVSVMASPPTAPRSRAPRRSGEAASTSIEAFARVRAESVAGGAELAPEVAEAFEGVESRLPLYQSYEETLSELSRRIESALPADDGVRDDWDRLVFEPLTERLIEAVRGAGLDLARPEARARPLSPQQKERLAEVFSGVARGFRSLGPEAAGRDDAMESGDRAEATGLKGRGR